MGKFKVGDRVRVAADGYGHAEVGQQGIVDAIECGAVSVEMDAPFDGHGKSRRRWNFFSPETELVPVAEATSIATSTPATFKVGDRVRVLDNLTRSGSAITEYPVGSIQTIERTCRDGEGGVGYLFNGHFQYLRPAQIKPATPTIREGRFYKTRDGRKVGPMYEGRYGGWYDKNKTLTGYSWNDAGVYITGQTSHLDLIAEWVDDPDANDAPAAAVKDSLGATMTWLHGLSPFVFEDGEVKIRGMQFAPTPAIVCLMRDGKPRPSARTHVHGSVAAAEREAGRLARKYPGREFAVFEMGAVTKHEPDHEWQRLALGGKHDEAAAALQESAGVDRWAAQSAVYNFAA